MTITEKIEIIDNKIEQARAQYDLGRQIATQPVHNVPRTSPYCTILVKTPHIIIGAK